MLARVVFDEIQTIVQFGYKIQIIVQFGYEITLTHCLGLKRHDRNCTG